MRTKIHCYYPRFLTLIFNHLVSSEQQRAFANNEFEVSMSTHKNFFTRLDTQHRLGRPVVITPFMANFIDNLPTIPAPVPESQTPVDQSTQAGTSARTSEQVLSPIQVATPPTISLSEPQVGNRADQEVVEPQLPTQVIEPYIESYIPLTSQPLQKLPFRRDRSTLSDTVSEPAALPPLKKRRTILEASGTSSVSSQKDTDLEMASYSSSQQGDVIDSVCRPRPFVLSQAHSLFSQGEKIFH